MVDWDLLSAALALGSFDAQDAHASMAPAYRGVTPLETDTEPARTAAALIYVFERAGRLQFPLTLRRDDLREHKGQVSLPGGRPEPGGTRFGTARREALEEIGLDPVLPRALGRLADVYIPVTHTTLAVHVAGGPDPGGLTPDPREVAEVRLVALDDLLAPGMRREETRTIHDRRVAVPFFALAGWKVWGATAIALADLSARIERATS